MNRAKCIMVQGTMSGAGKSLLCAALCRIFRQDGYRVAPFKSQNMALNSYITRDGLEMGRAQVMQAEAAGIEPDVRMNPILLKPCSDTGSQVIVCGKVKGQMPAKEYFRYKKQLIPDILEAYRTLAEENDIIVIEGAGSPAEINLKTEDIVNMGLAKMVDAPVLLVGDIDRGGVFAQLYGTTALLEPDEYKRVKGLVVNKFRGDPTILEPGLDMLREKTGVPVVGVVPYLTVDVDDEDSLAPRLTRAETVKPLDIAVVRFPRISNFTDFGPLEAHPMIGVRYVSAAKELGQPDLVILPGTKSTMDDLLWMRQNGLEAAVFKLAASNTPVLGICGGYQMLGDTLENPEKTEGERLSLQGMGLLPVRTTFTKEKTRTRVQGTVSAALWAGAKLDAYEIHMGETVVHGEPFALLADGTPDGCVCGSVFGTYLHGLFDTGEVTARLVHVLCEKKGLTPEEIKPIARRDYADQQYDRLAEGVRNAMDMEAIYHMLNEQNGRDDV
ncbi:MAG: cobyric acid synthase [Eubacteriales bacterium]|nr:cobyric acid synthase [Eubacteriales bacterium]